MNDVGEFLLFLLDKTHSELSFSPEINYPALNSSQSQEDRLLAINKYLKETADSPLSYLFRGALETSIHCRECQDTFHSFSPFEMLPIPIPSLIHVDFILDLLEYSSLVKMSMFVEETTQFSELINRINSVMKVKKEFKIVSVFKDSAKLIKKGENVVKFYNKGYLLAVETEINEGFNWFLSIKSSDKSISFPIVINLKEDDALEDGLNELIRKINKRLIGAGLVDGTETEFENKLAEKLISYELKAIKGEESKNLLELLAGKSSNAVIAELQRDGYKFEVEIKGLTSEQEKNFMKVKVIKPKFGKVPTIIDCFSSILAEEKFEKGNLYNCKNCCKGQQANRKTTIAKLPQYLMLSLNRFSWKKGNSEVLKTEEAVEIQIDGLDLSQFTSQPNSTYDLVSVVNHYGSSKGGHFTTLVRNDDTWYEMQEKAFYEIDEEFIQSGNAYMLLYRLIN